MFKLRKAGSHTKACIYRKSFVDRNFSAQALLSFLNAKAINRLSECGMELSR